MLVLANPTAGIEAARYAATRGGDNAWRLDGLRIPLAGRWQLRVGLPVTGFDKVTIEVTPATCLALMPSRMCLNQPVGEELQPTRPNVPTVNSICGGRPLLPSQLELVQLIVESLQADL